MSTLRITLCLILLFGVGAFAGSTFTRAKDRRAFLLANAEDTWLQRLHDQYAAELGMTPDQIKQVQPAMEEARSQFRQVREDSMQKSRRIMNALYHAVQSQLTSEQQQKFTHLVKERHGLRKTDGAPNL